MCDDEFTLAVAVSLSSNHNYLYLQLFGCNFECKVFTCNHHLCAPNWRIVDCSVQYSSVTIACMGLQSL